jgi:hypothetical protein
MNNTDIGTPIALTMVGIIVLILVYLIIRSNCSERDEMLRFSNNLSRRIQSNTIISSYNSNIQPIQPINSACSISMTSSPSADEFSKISP